LGKSYLGIGASHQQLEHNDSAYYYYNLAKPYLMQIKDSVELLGIEANITLMMNDFKEKEERYKLQAEIRHDLGDLLGETQSYNNLGLLYLNHKYYDKAFIYYNKSYDIAIKKDYNNDYFTSKRGLALSLYYLGEYQKAVEYFIEYDSVFHMGVHSADYKDKILELETKYKTAEIERDNLLKQNQIEENKHKLNLLYIALLILVILSTLLYFFIEQRRKRYKLEKEKISLEANQKIKDLIKESEISTTYALLEGQDKERKRIAADLHDNLGNILVTLNMYADTLLKKSNQEELSKLAMGMSSIAQQANEEVRKISHSLDSGMLNHFGLKAGINQLLEAVSESTKIDIQAELHLKSEFIDQLGMDIYRIIQELVTNSLKHSGCTKIRLEVTQLEEEINIIYQDNGKGFDPLSSKNGIGLSNIQKRIDRLDGLLNIDSKVGGGSTFIIELPIV